MYLCVNAADDDAHCKCSGRGLPYMTSTSFWSFLTPPSLSANLLHLFIPPSLRTSYMEASVPEVAFMLWCWCSASSLHAPGFLPYAPSLLPSHPYLAKVLRQKIRDDSSSGKMSVRADWKRGECSLTVVFSVSCPFGMRHNRSGNANRFWHCQFSLYTRARACACVGHCVLIWMKC